MGRGCGEQNSERAESTGAMVEGAGFAHYPSPRQASVWPDEEEWQQIRSQWKPGQMTQVLVAPSRDTHPYSKGQGLACSFDRRKSLKALRPFAERLAG